MAFASGADLHPDPPAYRIGIDVMLLQLPQRTTYAYFVETISDQVSISSLVSPLQDERSIDARTAHRL